MTDPAAFFTRSDGSYLFARWGRPIAPVIFGADDASLPVLKGAFEAMSALTGHPMAETDPELGANMLMFLVRDWDELRGVPDLDRLVPDLDPLIGRLEAAEANQYRVFRFDPEAAGAGIRAAVVMLRMDAELSAMPAGALALGQAAQTMLLWSDTAFQGIPPLMAGEAGVFLRPEVAAILRAAYDPVMPVAARDASHALRLAARMRVQ